MASIQRPVGLKCNGIGNDASDVYVVQVLLNKFLLVGCLGPIIPLVVDGQCGNKTCEALYAFQRGIMGWKKSDMRVDPGGATLARLNGPLKWVNQIPGYPVVIDDWKPKAPDDDDYKLTGVGFKFDDSRGIDIGGKYGGTAGTLKVTDMANLKSYTLNYAAVGAGVSTPVNFSFSTYDMTSVGLVYPIGRTHEELTLDDITGWCLIYQVQGSSIMGGLGGSVTLMLLSVGAGLVGGLLASLTGAGALLAPAIVLKSCRAAVAQAGWNATIPSAGVSGAIGYLGFGDVKGKLAVFQ